jgi:hypothetical protein
MTKIKRNDKCPCGSLKKYKICCINNKTNKYSDGQSTHTPNIQQIIHTLKDNLSKEDNKYNIIDITDDLTEVNYRDYQLHNMNENIVMVAEKTIRSELVFFSRTNHEPNTNIIIMYKGAYRTFPHDKFLLMLNSIIIFIKS